LSTERQGILKKLKANKEDPWKKQEKTKRTVGLGKGKRKKKNRANVPKKKGKKTGERGGKGKEKKGETHFKIDGGAQRKEGEKSDLQLQWEKEEKGISKKGKMGKKKGGGKKKRDLNPNYDRRKEKKKN